MEHQPTPALEYIEHGDKKHLVDEADLIRYLNQGEENFEINYRLLQEASDALFGDKKGMDMNEYLRLTHEFYTTLDLSARGIPSLMLDTELLLTYFTRARQDILKKTTPAGRTNRVLVIGCGPGRLSTLYVEMAKKLGIKRITFSDLLETHVEQTKEKLQKAYNSGSPGSSEMMVDDVKIDFLPGDFVTVDIENTPYDIATAIWFVTSEILDPSLPANLRRRRIEFFKKVQETLIRKGIFIEDIPESGLSGKHFLSRMKTMHILRKKGILLGEEGNLSLTNIAKPSGGNPYHLRYLPFNGTHQKEMNVSGLYALDSITVEIPTRSFLTGAPNYTELFQGKTLSEIQQLVRRLVSDVTEFPASDAVDRQMKKITLWTPSPD